MNTHMIALSFTGLMPYVFQYAVNNRGLDSEGDYQYTGLGSQCWAAAESRHVATIDGYKNVTVNSEAQLVAAVQLGPVAVAIEADQSAFQSYKSGVFDGPCGTSVDHGVHASLQPNSSPILARFPPNSSPILVPCSSLLSFSFSCRGAGGGSHERRLHR